eukprot:11078426-Alexandrium_andersonii.AAC.1
MCFAHQFVPHMDLTLEVLVLENKPKWPGHKRAEKRASISTGEVRAPREPRARCKCFCACRTGRRAAEWVGRQPKRLSGRWATGGRPGRAS